VAAHGLIYEKFHFPKNQGMELLLKRSVTPDATRTFGKLFIDGVMVCHTLEDEVRELLNKPVYEWKVQGATAIPSTDFVGEPYLITLEQSPRFGADTITVWDVPGFTGVRIHAGNTEADTQGCPLLGMDVNAAGIVPGTSRPAVALVKGRIAQAMNAGATVRLTIVNEALA
jgi:hypothetical protein